MFLPRMNALCEGVIRSAITLLSLLARIFEKILMTACFSHIGLKSVMVAISDFFGINTTYEELNLETSAR